MELVGSLNASETEKKLSIVNIKEVSPFCLKITESVGLSFFIRLDYLKKVMPGQIVLGANFSDEYSDDLLEAAESYNAECAAMCYLSRSEQCRFSLEQKLNKKGYSKVAIANALDYLEGKHYLSDDRYAAAWLRNRAITHTEGKARLFAELLARGINRETISQAIESFFHDTSEAEVLIRAVEKCKRLGKSSEKINAYLMRCGFSYSMIKNVENIDKIDITKYAKGI